MGACDPCKDLSVSSFRASWLADRRPAFVLNSYVFFDNFSESRRSVALEKYVELDESGAPIAIFYEQFSLFFSFSFS